MATEARCSLFPPAPAGKPDSGLLLVEVVPAAAAARVPRSGACSWEDAGPKSSHLGPSRGSHLRPGTGCAAVDRRLQKINVSSFWTNL